jgi:hypothetical protein
VPRSRRVTRAVVASVIVALAMAGLVVQAARGNAVVSDQSSSATVRDAHVDDAFYRCLEIQARSLVQPGQTVAVKDNLGNLVTLLKAVGSWMTVADPSSHADVVLRLRNGPAAPGTCLGTVVVGTTHIAGRGTVVRIGTGAQVPGQGPPPPPPL